MAITSYAKLKLHVEADVKDSSLSGSAATRSGKATISDIALSFADDAGWSCSQLSLTLAAATPQDIDLDGASIVSLINDAITFDKIHMLLIVNTGTTNPMTVEGDFLGLTTDTDTIEASTSALQAFRAYGFGAGRTVTTDTADVVTLTSTLGTTCEVFIFGDID